MIINAQALDLVLSGFKKVYTDAYLNAPTHWDKIAMTVPSTSRDETYGWLGQFPNLREWIGSRVVYGLEAYDFKIKNKDFESTIQIPRNDIQDDRLGVFKPALSEMGHLAKQHPEQLIFNLLTKGFETLCYDGQPFFDADHPIADEKADAGTKTVSNMQAGGGPAWYLLDTSRQVRPIIWQERQPYNFVSMTDVNDANVFFNKEFIYGVNAGFGLWQLAFGSKATLTQENYAAARAAMMGYQADGGRILGINPTTLVVPPTLESDALHILNTDTKDGGGSNPWKDTAELIVSPFAVAA